MIPIISHFMKRSNHTSINNRTRVSLSAVQKCFNMEIIVLKLSCTILAVEYAHDIEAKKKKKSEIRLAWIVGNHNVKCHFKLTCLTCITTLQLTVSEWVISVEKKEMSKGWYNCCLQLPVGGL